jgi:hypothetical protein
MSGKRGAHLSEAGRENSSRKDKGTKRSLYVRKATPADDDEPVAETLKSKPSLPVLKFLQTRVIDGERV